MGVWKYGLDKRVQCMSHSLCLGERNLSQAMMRGYCSQAWLVSWTWYGGGGLASLVCMWWCWQAEGIIEREVWVKWENDGSLNSGGVQFVGLFISLQDFRGVWKLRLRHPLIICRWTAFPPNTVFLSWGYSLIMTNNSFDLILFFTVYKFRRFWNIIWAVFIILPIWS